MDKIEAFSSIDSTDSCRYRFSTQAGFDGFHFRGSRRPSLEWIALQDEVHEDGQKYSRAELRALLALHAPEERKQESEASS